MVKTDLFFHGTLHASPETLTPAQKAMLGELLGKIHHYAKKLGPVPDRNSTAHASRPKSEDLCHQRPCNTFVIKGGRGYGKSTLLQALAHASEYLDSPHRDTCAAEYFAKLDLDVGLAKSTPEYGRASLSLPILYPELLDHGETSLSEQIIIQIHRFLDEKKNDFPIHDSRAKDTRTSIDRLTKTLRDPIATSLLAAQESGMDKIRRDSINFEAYVTKRIENGDSAWYRQQEWRRFIDEFLREMGCRTLLLMIDDCDLAPDLALQLSESLRLYLCHPRIIVVLALEMQTLRDIYYADVARRYSPLIQHAEALLGPAAKPQDSGVGHLVRGVDALIDKLMPPQHRHVLTPVGEAEVWHLLERLDPRRNREQSTPTNHSQTDTPLPSRAFGADLLEFLHLGPSETEESWISQARAEIWLWRTRYHDLFDGLSLRQLRNILECIHSALRAKQRWSLGGLLYLIDEHTDDLLCRDSLWHRIDGHNCTLQWLPQRRTEPGLATPQMSIAGPTENNTSAIPLNFFRLTLFAVDSLVAAGKVFCNFDNPLESSVVISADLAPFDPKDPATRDRARWKDPQSTPAGPANAWFLADMRILGQRLTQGRLDFEMLREIGVFDLIDPEGVKWDDIPFVKYRDLLNTNLTKDMGHPVGRLLVACLGAGGVKLSEDAITQALLREEPGTTKPDQRNILDGLEALNMAIETAFDALDLLYCALDIANYHDDLAMESPSVDPDHPGRRRQRPPKHMAPPVVVDQGREGLDWTLTDAPAAILQTLDSLAPNSGPVPPAFAWDLLMLARALYAPMARLNPWWVVAKATDKSFEDVVDRLLALCPAENGEGGATQPNLLDLRNYPAPHLINIDQETPDIAAAWNEIRESYQDLKKQFQQAKTDLDESDFKDLARDTGFSVATLKDLFDTFKGRVRETRANEAG